MDMLTEALPVGMVVRVVRITTPDREYPKAALKGLKPKHLCPDFGLFLLLQTLFWSSKIARCQRPDPAYRILWEALTTEMRGMFYRETMDFCQASKYVALCSEAIFFHRVHGNLFNFSV